MGVAGRDLGGALGLDLPSLLGILNLLLYEAGLIDRYLPWLTDPALVRISVVVAHVWTQFPFAAVLLMAALAAIDPQLYEAAKIDGAGRWQRFRFVTFPQIKAMIVVLLVYAALVAFTSYDLVYAMTGGGPGTATTLLSFRSGKRASACTISATAPRSPSSPC